MLVVTRALGCFFAPAIVCTGMITVFHLPDYSDPPTEGAFPGMTSLSPPAGISGLTLAVDGLLPGARKEH